MNCSICQHPQQGEIIIDYAYTSSLRATAEHFGVGYRSLHRHIERCIYALMEEDEQNDYQKAFEETADILRTSFKIYSKPRRPKSIITKNVDFTWSRRGWQKNRK